jgi:hypothetical protein
MHSPAGIKKVTLSPDADSTPQQVIKRSPTGIGICMVKKNCLTHYHRTKVWRWKMIDQVSFEKNNTRWFTA